MIIDDPRIDRTKKHEFIDILVIAICGAETWTDINTIIEISSSRIIKKTGEVSEQTRSFISNGKKDAEEFFKAIRGHWEIENKLDWSLDE